MRRTLSDVRHSMLPTELGLCQSDIPAIANYINLAQEILVPLGGESGWWGCTYKTAFNVPIFDPYITLPRGIARVAGAQMCKFPVRIQNQWYEFLEAGAGGKPSGCGMCEAPPLELYDRGTVPTAYDIKPDKPQLVRVYMTDPLDEGKRVLIDGLDQNSNGIYSLDGVNSVKGFYLRLESPFSTSAFTLKTILSIQKDRTFGDVVLQMVDPDTGTEILLSRYQPDETNPCYRRYYANALPSACCKPTDPALVNMTQLTVMASLDFVPAYRDTDFLLIGCLPALLEECRSIKHSKVDDPAMKQMSMVEHRTAIRHLNNELKHYLGTMQPAIVFAPFGTARLERQMIGRLI